MEEIIQTLCDYALWNPSDFANNTDDRKEEFKLLINNYVLEKCKEQKRLCSDYLQKQESGIVGDINYFDSVDFPALE